MIELDTQEIAIPVSKIEFFNFYSKLPKQFKPMAWRIWAELIACRRHIKALENE